MDAKDLRIESALGAHTNDGSTKYAPSATALQNSAHKSYDIGANPLAKVDAPTSRPCAIIGPDRVVPPQPTSNVYSKKIPAEPWLGTDILYQPPPEYPHNPADYPPPRNISPRQTFQENMQRIMVPPTYVSVKNSEERNLKFSKSMPSEAKFCDVPFTISPINTEPKNVKISEGLVPNNNVAYSQPVPPQNWSNSSINVRPLKPYGAPELYQYSEYPHYPGPRPLSMIRPHRNIHEDMHQHQDHFYQEANIRFKPYPSPKERPLQSPHHPQGRYDYIANYPNSFHIHNPYIAHKYDVQKSMPPQPCPVYPPVSLKYLDRRFPTSNTERYQRSPNQQVNFNPHFYNQNIPPTYGSVPGNCLQNRPYPVSQDPSTKPIMQNRLYFDNNNVRKYYPNSENVYVNEVNRPQTMKNDALYPSYPPMHSLSPHHMYRKESLKGYEHYRNFEYPANFNSLSRLPLQFSPKTISISPDSNTSIDTTQALSAQDDCGYVSQSSTASVKSIEAGVHRISNDTYQRHETRFEAPFLNKSGQVKDATSSKDKKGIDVRQFLQMWNEGDDEGNENNKESTIQKNSTTSNNITHVESTNNQEQLYVLGLVNVPNEELCKYDHIQKISKLPENIKGYNNIELLNQYEKLVESPSNNNFSVTPSPHKQKNLHGIRNAIARHGMEMPPRPISPLDVEAKISQSVIHKEVGCNFEIRPCSPQMLNVEIATPVHKVLGERLIEKVVNPVIPKSPMLFRVEESNNISSPRISPKVQSCNMVHNQYPSPGINDSIKTNYCIQDLESNSGVCLASLPRLDNDIELNFPEINQQFIDANKMESSSISTLQDLPILDTENMTTISKSEDKSLNKSFISEHKQGFEPDKEVPKLSKYRKHKRTDSIVNDSNVNKTQNMALHRTNSVIIKNPDNTKRQEDHVSMSIINNKYVSGDTINNVNELKQSDKGSYVNQNVNKTTNVVLDHCPAPTLNETAIDFSLNKNIEQTNDIDSINNIGGSFVNNIDIEKNVFDGTTSDVRSKINSKAQGNVVQEENPASDSLSIFKPDSSSLDNFTSPNIDVNSNEEKFTENLISNTVLEDKIDFQSINDNPILHESVITHSNLKEIVTETSVATVISPEDELQQQNPSKHATNVMDYMKTTNHNNSPLGSYTENNVLKDSFLEHPIVIEPSFENLPTEKEPPLKNLPFPFHNDKHSEKYENCPKHNETLPSNQSDITENHSSKIDESNEIVEPVNISPYTLVAKAKKESNSVNNFSVESEKLANEIRLRSVGHTVNQVITENVLSNKVNSVLPYVTEINNCDNIIENETNVSEKIQNGSNNVGAIKNNESEMSNIETEIQIRNQRKEKELIELENKANSEITNHNLTKRYEINVIDISNTDDNVMTFDKICSDYNNRDSPKELKLISETDLNSASPSSEVKIDYKSDDKVNSKDISDDMKNNPESELSSTSINETTVVTDEYIVKYRNQSFHCRKELFSPWFQKLLFYSHGVVTSLQKSEKTNPTNSLHTDKVNVNISIKDLKDNILDYEPKNDIINLNTDKEETNRECLNTREPSQEPLGNKITAAESEECDFRKDFNKDIEMHSESNAKEFTKCFTSESHLLENYFMEPLQQSTIQQNVENERTVDSTIYKTNDDDIENLMFEAQSQRELLRNKRIRTLKRSLSESAVTEYTNITDCAKENCENYVFANKRTKINDSEILVESNVIAENITSFIQNNRRNSISTFYNDDNVSFCIVIDNDCVLTEENEDCEKICITEIPDNCLTAICTDTETITSESNEVETCEDSQQCEYNNELIINDFDNRTIEETWVEDVACMETVYSDDIAEDIVISAPISPKSTASTEEENDSNDFDFNVNKNEHTDKVKHIYGNQMCDDDAQLVEKLYRTPQMDVNKTLIDRESRSSGEYNRYYDNEALERILSESYISETQSLILNKTDTSPINTEHGSPTHISGPVDLQDSNLFNDIGYSEPKLVDKIFAAIDRPKIDETRSNQETCKMSVNGQFANTCESSKDNWFPDEKEDKLHYAISSSPEVSSTTSDEKGSAILLKIRSYKGTKISEISEMCSSFNFSQSQSCKNAKFNLSTSRPLITKAAQKYIPPLKETICDLKVKLHLPKQSLYKLQQLKKSKEEPKINTSHNKNFIKSLPREHTKNIKPKPKFEDVLKSIDEIQFKKQKEKNRKSKQSIPKVIIKKNENGAHYASTQSKEKFNPDLTGRKWQPWVFLEKNSFIDKMALKQKFKAIYSHRKKTYVLAESFRKYKSYSNSKFEISHPKPCDGVSTGKLKYTIRLKHI